MFTIGVRLNYEPETYDYINGLTTPLSRLQLELVNKFIRKLKLGLNISHLNQAFDVMYILAGQTPESSLRNLVKRAHDGTAVNSPTFTAYEGYTGDGTSSYIRIPYNTATEGIRYTLNDAGLGIYLRTDAKEVVMGVRSQTTNYANFFWFNSTDPYNGWGSATGTAWPINNLGIVNWQISIAKRGMVIGTRDSSTNVSAFANKQKYDYINNSEGIPSSQYFPILARWSQTTFGNFSNSQASFAFVGKSISQNSADLLTDAFEEYMNARGKGVIA